MLIEGEVCDEHVPRWGNWRKKDTLCPWNWLRVLGLSPRRRPVLDSTEDLVVPKTEWVGNEIPECIDGLGERDLNIVDKTKSPKLTISEWNKLRSCV